MATDMSQRAETFDHSTLVSCASASSGVVVPMVVPHAEKPKKFTGQNFK